MMAGIKSCTWDTLIEVLENVKATDTLIEVGIFYSLSSHDGNDFDR